MTMAWLVGLLAGSEAWAAGQEPEPTAAPTAVVEEATSQVADDDAVPIRVIQRRRMLRAGRVEVGALGGLGVNDTMFRHSMAGGAGRYHISEAWSVGGSYGHYFAKESTLYKDVTERFELFPEPSYMRWSAVVDAAWTPVYGKFALLDQFILHFDGSLSLGAGVVQTGRRTSVKPVGVFGLGLRLYLTRWLALTMEVRDHVYMEEFNTGDSLVNHILTQAGLSVFAPFDFQYRFPR